MESLLYDVMKDACEKARGVELGERFFGLVHWMGTMAKTCSAEGLIALEEEAAKIPPEITLCREAEWVMRILCDVDVMKDSVELFTTRYLASDFQGEDALLYYTIISGFLKIQAGEDSAHHLEHLLTAWLPDETLHQYEEYRKRVGGGIG